VTTVRMPWTRCGPCPESVCCDAGVEPFTSKTGGGGRKDEQKRDGRVDTIDTRGIVPGDLVLLSAGCLVPADARIIEATDFFVSEAVMTGESFPVQKPPGMIDARSALAERTNCVFLGTNVRSGTARCLVTHTGAATEFGSIASRLMLRPPETEFDRGIRRFGYLLSSVMLILVVVVFTAHALQGRAAVETLLFAIALATPSRTLAAWTSCAPIRPAL
jgi:P-type Mg2+ transporter